MTTMPRITRHLAASLASNSPRRGIRKSALALAAAAVLGPLSVTPAAAAGCTWNTTSGNWAAIVNWSACATGNGNPVQSPGAADTATIGAAGLVTINTGQQILNLNNAGQITLDAFGLNLMGGGNTFNSGVINVGGASTANIGISAGHTLNNTGGVINIANGSVVNQFGSSFIGGVINTMGTGAFVPFNSGANVLSGVTLNGTLNMATGAQSRETIVGGLSLNGVAYLDNSSYLAFNGNQTLGGTGSIAFGNGSGGPGYLGVDGANSTLTIGSSMTVRGTNGVIGDQLLAGGGGGKIINQGLISSDGGSTILIRTLANGLTNTGTLQAAGAGSVLTIRAIAVANAGGQLSALGGGVLSHSGGTITGGTISTSGGGSFQPTNDGSNFLSGVTFFGTLNMATGAQTRENVVGGMTLNGTVNLGNSSYLAFNGTQALDGSGSIVFGDGSGGPGYVGVDGANSTLTIGNNMVIRGQSGIIGDQLLAGGGGGALINHGRVSSDVLAGTIILRALSNGITNHGILEAQNGGTLRLQSNVVGMAGSQILAGAASVVVQDGVTLSGAINTSGGGSFQPDNSNSNFLDSVSFAGVLNMATGSQVRERVVNGLSLGGTVTLNNSSYLAFQDVQTLSGTGTIIFGDGSNGPGYLAVDGANSVLTIGSGITVRGASGIIGDQVFVGGGGNSLVNIGRISSDVAGGTITIRNLVNGAINQGIMEAQNGGTLRLQSNVTGATGSQILSGAGSAVLQEGVTLSGAISVSGGGSFQPANSNGNFLDGVSFAGVLNMATGAQVRERVVNGLTLDSATINVSNSSYLAFQGTQTLGGAGSIVFGDGSGGPGYLGVDGAGTVLTIAPGVTVRGQTGVIGDQVFAGGGSNRLLNQGLISSDTGGTITIRNLASGLGNSATLRATGTGSVLNISNIDVDNTGGVINAQNNGVVLHSAGRITGGTLSSSGGGSFQATNSNSNFLDGVALAGVLNMATGGTTRERINNGLTNNGTIHLNSSSFLSFEGSQTLGGTGSIVFGDGSGGPGYLDVAGANTVLTIGAGATVRGGNGIIGDQNIVGGGGGRLINNGTINSDGGSTILIRTLSAGLANNGTLRAQSGTLTLANGLGGVTGTGTLQVDAAGTLNLANGGNSQGQLTMGAVGAAANIGTGNLAISDDYTNAGWGSGNSFSRRAGITGTGLIVASGDVAQVITGTGVTGGNTANTTLTIGNVRVGDNNYNYQIANVGTNGPTLRGALQTSVNGGNLTDARLSGTGVTASNYNTGAPAANSGNLGVTFTVASAGALAPFATGQVLNLRSNFENIADQKLNLALTAGAAAFNAAVGSATPSPNVVVSAQRVGGSNSVALTVANTAAAGPFSEDLNASFSNTTGSATGSGSITGRLAGSNNTGAGAMSVGVNTATSGAKSGTAVLAYQTAGAVNGASNGLGTLAAGSQSLKVSGNVYAPAVAQLNTLAADFGAVRVGTVVTPLNVAAANTASGTLTDTLRASLSGGPAPFTASGTATSIAAGASNNSSMTVALNTSTAGVFSSTGTVNFISQNPEMTDLALGTTNVALNATVNNLAAPSLAKTSGAGSFSGSGTSYTLNFGSLLQGGGTATTGLSLSNLVSGPADALAGSFLLTALAGTPFSAISGFGTFTGVAAGGSLAGGLSIGLNTNTLGNFSSSITLNPLSTNGSQADFALAGVTLNLQGSVVAVPEPGTWAMWLAGLAVLVGLARRRTLTRDA